MTHAKLLHLAKGRTISASIGGSQLGGAGVDHYDCSLLEFRLFSRKA